LCELVYTTYNLNTAICLGPLRGRLSLPQIKSARTDGAVHQAQDRGFPGASAERVCGAHDCARTSSSPATAASPAHHILGNAGLADIDAKLEQFAMDPEERPTKDWRCSSPGLIVGSQLAPLDGLDDAWTSSAKTIGNLHDATEPRYLVERWRARRGPSETGGRPSPERPCRQPKWHPNWLAPSQHDDLLFKHQDFGRCS
jgi:hypothetical protein